MVINFDIIELPLSKLSDTKKLAKKISQILPDKFVIALSGDLGAGKTTLVREILINLGITNHIKSPTFTLVEPYEIYIDVKSKYLKIYHFDLYRFNDFNDWFDLGFDEYFTENCVCFIEWYEKASDLIPHIDWHINLSYVKKNLRTTEIRSQTQIGSQLIEKLLM